MKCKDDTRKKRRPRLAALLLFSCLLVALRKRLTLVTAHRAKQKIETTTHARSFGQNEEITVDDVSVLLNPYVHHRDGCL